MVSMIAVVNQPIHRPREKPQPQPQPPSPRVHFASTKSLTTISRPLTTSENWTLYNFELHSRSCPDCQHPYKRWQAKKSLCATGASLAYQASSLCYLLDSQIYSRTTTTSSSSSRKSRVRLEVPHTYTFLRQHLKVMEEMARAMTAEDGGPSAPTPAPAPAPKVIKIHASSAGQQQAVAEKKMKRTDSMEVMVPSVTKPDTNNNNNGRRDKERRDTKYRGGEERDGREEANEHRHRDKGYRTEDRRHRDKGYRTEDRTTTTTPTPRRGGGDNTKYGKEERTTERKDKGYRHEDKRERRYRKEEQADVVVVKDKRYRTQDRRPDWV